MTSWTNLRRSSGETLHVFALEDPVERGPHLAGQRVAGEPAILGATSASTSSRTLRFGASHDE